MDTTQPGFWIAIGLGGSIVGALSAAQQFTQKSGSSDSAFRPQPVIRDFCFGAFLTAILYMFLPESITSWISAGQTLLSQASAKASSLASTATSSASDIELQTGPARF